MMTNTSSNPFPAQVLQLFDGVRRFQNKRHLFFWPWALATIIAGKKHTGICIITILSLSGGRTPKK